MSAYKQFVDIRFKDRECLFRALRELGFEDVECHDRAVTLYGYHGDARAERAEIVIRRRYVGSASNDVGFRWDPALRAYVPIVSEYDEGSWLGGEWKAKLKTAYARAAVRKLARLKRGRIVSDIKRGQVQVLKVRCYA